MDKRKMNVAYVRLSEDDLEKKEDYSASICNQLSQIKEYAKRMNFEIDKEYIDDGYSGINFDRPAFEKLKADIDKGLIATIVTKDMSRLGREFIETAYYISEFFPKNEVRYIAINDEFDSNDSDNINNDIMVGIRSILNDRLVKDTSVKRQQVAYSKTSDGEFIGFIAPYGYKIIKNNKKRTLEIDEYAAGIVKRIFMSIAIGKTRSEIAEELNKDKILPPFLYMNMTLNKNKKYYNDWSKNIIYRILKNETYLGKLVVRKSIKMDYKQKKRVAVPIRDRQTKNNTHPAIISESLFNEANLKIKTCKSREKNNYDGTFSGLVICGICGRNMSACRTTKQNGNIKYYFICTRVEARKKCTNRVLYDSKLKDIIYSNIKELIDNFVEEEEIIDSVSNDIVKKNRLNLKISNIKQNIEIHNNNIKNLYFKKIKSEITLSEFIDKKKKESLLVEKLEDELKQLIEKYNIETKKTEVKENYKKFIDGDILMKEYIRELIEKILVHKDNTIQIVFKFNIGKTKNIRLY